MMIANGGFKTLFEDMGIDLGRRHIGVAKHLLNRPQIRPMGKKMAREGMAHHVRRHAA